MFYDMSKTKSEKIESVHKLGRRFSDVNVSLHAAIASKVGLAEADHKYLGIIIENEKLTGKEIAELTGLTAGAVTGLIDRLADKNLVKRVPDDHDRRKVFIVPDFQSIKKLFGNIFPMLVEHMSLKLKNYSVDELSIVERYLDDMVNVMDSLSEKILTE